MDNNGEGNFTNTFLMKQILEEMAILKSKMPNGELQVMQTAFEGMRKDISDMKKKLLDPEDGVIVKVNENTKFRLSEENRYEDYMKINLDVDSIKKWQGGVNKALWMIFGAIIAIAIKVLFGVNP